MGAFVLLDFSVTLTQFRDYTWKVTFPSPSLSSVVLTKYNPKLSKYTWTVESQLDVSSEVLGPFTAVVGGAGLLAVRPSGSGDSPCSQSQE